MTTTTAAAATPTARDVRAALHQRYNRPSQGREGEQWICLEEARSGAGFDGNQGQCDFLAINTWRSRGMELIGHEIKVSMADWRTELANPAKADLFARYCRRWFLVAPAGLAARIKDEVPPAWGLLSVATTGRITQARPAPAQKRPEPVPEWWWVGWLAQIDRQHKRRLPDLITQGMAREREDLEQRIQAEVNRNRRYQDEAAEKMSDNARRLKAATGIDLAHAWAHDFEKLRRAWAMARNAPALSPLIGQLRRTADALHAMDDQIDLTDQPQEDR